MANSLTKSPLIVDTAGASMLDTRNLFVDGVRWVGGTTAGHTAVIQDADSRVILTMVATAANYTESVEIPMYWRGGFKVPTLASGVLYIYLRDRN